MQPLTPDDLLIRHTPVDDSAWEQEQQQEVARKVPLERFQTLEHVIRDSPLTVDPYLELARIYLQQRRWNDAKRVLESALSKFPEDEEANYLHEEAQMARSLQLHAAAVEEHKSQPTRLTAEHLERCRIELNVLRERVCRNRLQRHPDQLELNLPLATALENLGKRDEAIQTLSSVVHIPKLRATAALQLGQLQERAGAIPQALSAYRQAALFRVPSPEPEVKIQALRNAANLAERTQMIDSARRYVTLLLKEQPEDLELRQRLERLNATPL